MKKNKANIKDVAALAGISATTVSAYLNKTAPVNVKTAKRIKEAIEELDYKPNLIARSLKIRNSKTIGLIFPDIENTFFIKLIRKAEEVAFENGYTVILCNTQNKPDMEKLYIEVLKGKMVDGFLIITSFKDKGYLENILKGEKVVYVDRHVGIKNEIVLKLDNVKGLEMAVDYLVSLGHKRIGYINVKPDITVGIERLKGYKNSLKKANIPLIPDLLKFSGFSIESSYEKAKELLTQKNRPTALVSVSNRITIGALQAIKDLNLRIPDDISVVGFDDIITANILSPPLTVVDQPAYDFGKIGIDILINRINGKKVENRIIKLEPELIIRESCKKL